MSKLMGKIMEQWEAVEMVIGMNESVDEAANSSLLKKAQAIASKLSGNMTKAVAEIEKLKKGLSDDKKVMAMLKTANEAVNELKVDQEVTANIKGKKVRVRIIAIDSDKNPNLAMHVVDLKDPDKDYFVKRKDVKEATIPQGKTAMTKKDSVTKKDRNTLSKIGKMLDKEKKSRKEAMAMCEQCGKMHEEGACGESVKEARLDKADYYAIAKMETGGYRPKVINKETGKAIYVGGVYFKDEKSAKGHAQAYLDGYVAAGGNERRASKATAAYDKSNASKIKESVDEAVMSARAQFKDYADKYGIKAHGMNNPKEAEKVLKFIFNAYKGKLTADMMNDLVKNDFFKDGIKANKAGASNDFESVNFSNNKWVQQFDYVAYIKKNAGLKEDAYGESVDEAVKVLAKKGDYVFAKDTNKDIGILTYKGKEISSGDYDDGAASWFLDIKGTKGQQSFDSGDDVIKFFMKNKITEAVSVDRRTMGFKEAMKRRAEAKAKREAMKIKAAKKQSKTDMANIDANYAYDGDIEEILTSANKKIMGEDAPVNASSSGAVDMNPTGKSKKKDKESLVTRSASLMAKRGY